jgi:hypothetical protein
MRTCAGEPSADESAAALSPPPASGPSRDRDASNCQQFRNARGLVMQRYAAPLRVRARPLFTQTRHRPGDHARDFGSRSSSPQRSHRSVRAASWAGPSPSGYSPTLTSEPTRRTDQKTSHPRLATPSRLGLPETGVRHSASITSGPGPCCGSAAPDRRFLAANNLSPTPVRPLRRRRLLPIVGLWLVGSRASASMADGALGMHRAEGLLNGAEGKQAAPPRRRRGSPAAARADWELMPVDRFAQPPLQVQHLRMPAACKVGYA